MKRKLFLTLGLIVLFQFSFAQDFYSDFYKSLQKKDTVKEWITLKKWSKTNPKDPELYAAYFNYYFNRGRQDIMKMSSARPPAGKQVLELKDSTGNYKGYIGDTIIYNIPLIKTGLAKIDEGIKLYPDRLDMRFGKIHALGEIKDWNAFTSEIIKTIDYSAKNKNHWTWTKNEKLKGGKKEFIASIQDYQLQLFNTGDSTLIPYTRVIAKEVLKFYPNDIDNLSNLAIGYLLTKKYDKALPYLLKTVKIQPTDYIDLSNIAYAFKHIGDTNRAILYYKKVLKYGDKQYKANASEALKELKKE